MNARKYIIVPECRPLWAMRECWGPEFGPLSPTPVPTDIIGKLLLQKGDEAVTILEVTPKAGTKAMRPPVKLTLDNYRKPYEEIAGITETPKVIITEPPKANAPIAPVDVAVKKPDEKLEEVAPEKEEISDEQNDNDSLGDGIDTSDTETVTTPADSEEEGETDTDEVTESTSPKAEHTDPYAGMTKAERRRARREAELKASMGNKEAEGV